MIRLQILKHVLTPNCRGYLWWRVRGGGRVFSRRRMYLASYQYYTGLTGFTMRNTAFVDKVKQNVRH